LKNKSNPAGVGGKKIHSGSLFGRILHMTGKELKLLKTDKFNLFIALFLLPIAITLYAIMITQAAVPAPVSIAIVSYDSNTYLSFEVPDLNQVPQNMSEYYQQQFDIVLSEFLNGSQTYDEYANNDTFSNITDPGELKVSLFNRYESALIDAFNSSENINLKYFYNGSVDYAGMNKARDHLTNKHIQCIVVIPADFSELLLYRMPGLVETIPETSDLLEIQRIVNSIQDGIDIFAQSQNMTPRFLIEKTSLYDIPEGFDPNYNYQITKILSFIVFGVSCVLTILVVVQEKAVARLLLTPVKRYEILTAKFLAYSLVLTGQILLIYFTTVWNGLFILGRLSDLFIAMFLIGFIGIALGMFISTISKTNQEANQLFFAIFIIIVIFSGIFIPIASMPSYLQFIANYLPLAHGDPLIRGIVSRGSSFRGPDFNFLTQQAMILVVATYLLFQRKAYEV
jgi:ABC-2 type transport system permease protein